MIRKMSGHSQNGFSLPEILIVLGISGFVMAGILSLLEFSAKGARTQRVAVKASDVREDVRGLLSSADACKLSFSGANLGQAKTGKVPFTAIVDKTGKHVFDVGTPDKENVLKINAISIVNYVDVDTTSGRADLQIGVEEFGTQTKKMSFNDRTITLQVFRDSSNKLASCVSLAGMTDGLWRQIPNTYDIFYTGGNVGIGTPTPQAALHVVGTLWAKPECHIVNAPSLSATYIATAACAADEYVLNGGGQCLSSGVMSFSGTNTQGVLTMNEPQANTWVVQCYDVTNDYASASQAFATCCKSGAQ